MLESEKEAKGPCLLSISSMSHSDRKMWQNGLTFIIKNFKRLSDFSSVQVLLIFYNVRILHFPCIIEKYFPCLFGLWLSFVGVRGEDQNYTQSQIFALLRLCLIQKKFFKKYVRQVTNSIVNV